MHSIRFHFGNFICHTLFLAAAFVSCNVFAQSSKEELFASVLAGAECKQTLNNGLICEYKVGRRLRFSVKDAGGNDQVIAFSHSDWDDDYLAVMYFGCIVVVPGASNKEKYGGDGVYIAPKTGRVFLTLPECQDANK